MEYGLLGRTLGHSFSPQIHAMLGEYPYSLFPREPEEVADLLHDPAIGGLNVTIPYKRTVLGHLDHIDPLAQRLGSVNTIVREQDGKLHGYNTDYHGFMSTLCRSGIYVGGKKALVLGTGGASAPVSAVLEDLGAQVVMISRTGENNYQNLFLHRDAAVIVNTTPVGMYPNTGTAPVDIRQVPALEGVFDLIYNPSKTKLLLDCQSAGIPGYNGLWMLVAQAKKSSEYFTGRSISDDLAETIYHKLRSQTRNIVLIGMPGCGKSTIGQLVAQNCGKRFVDCDQVLAQRAGRSIPDLLESEGEDAFRNMETEVLADLGRESGLVIATGGGCVTQPRNLPLLRQNGRIFWIQRDVNALPTEGRPLSIRSTPAALYAQRLPMYQVFADCIISNDGTCQDAAQAIIAQWEEES